MSSEVPSMKVKSATSKLRPFDMSSSLITTSNFGVMKPIKAISCVPGDKISLSVSEFTRLMPMPVPTYGSIKSKTRAFFVPFRIILKPWLSLISNNKKVTSTNIYNPVRVPTIEATKLLEALTSVKFSSKHPADYSGAFDFQYSKQKYTLTPLGKRVVDFFCSIGFNLLESSSNIVISFMPFMAFAKFYLDWVVPSRFINLYSDILKLFEFETSEAVNNYIKNVENLRKILIAFYSYYEDDYFTSAWQNSSGTEIEMASDTVIPGQIAQPSSWRHTPTNPSSTGLIPDDFGAVRGNESLSPLTQGYQQSGDPLFLNNGATASQFVSMQTVEKDTDPIDISVVAPLNYFTLRSIGALQDMINRGKLSGTKVQEYLRVTYGFEPSVDAMNLSTYLGCKENEIMIGDVMATAGTDINSLGQYAGRGIGSGDASFSYECKEHGIFFVTNELTVKPSYIDGLDFVFDQKERLDFYQPEFDNIGCEALPLRRLSSSAAHGPNSNQYLFGFTPRYSAYKFAFDRLSGDFRLGSKNSGLDSWYLSRTFNTGNASSWRFINDEFCKATSDNSMNNLDRIFADTTNDNDHFYSVFRIGCRMMRPMLPFSEALETYQHNELGKELNGSINGGLSR